ncbi:transcriptional regulator, TetR family [Anaerococcus hydrogenalis DSM 7454]|uniref:Transcriptional regulator, TetR family n=1 Tax=Anaerococcus hydrogenalis DSM 7454 TaxID=561177 RepID=B6W769_9FIRM|nr:TetR/AcrR family transcriptional regulator [Anaerococcus hydrogenalis]EEB36743.1 transcriptional regulator, TetR family [Anaerococcus hydrogenalis DSM 7454]
MNTKEKIYLNSLELFSTYGYSDVSMEKIAKEVGIKAPSIYKHFKSKKTIFETILKDAVIKIDQKIDDVEDYKIMKNNQKTLNIEKLSIDIFKYLLHDPFVSKVRKMLSIEMYKNPQAMQFYVEKFIHNPMTKQQKIIDYYGLSKFGDLEVLSTIFYSPILLAVKLYDANPEKEEELINLLKNSYKQLEKIIS